MSFHASFAQDRERLFRLRRAVDPCDVGQDALFHAAIGHRGQDASAAFGIEARI